MGGEGLWIAYYSPFIPWTLGWVARAARRGTALQRKKENIRSSVLNLIVVVLVLLTLFFVLLFLLFVFYRLTRPKKRVDLGFIFFAFLLVLLFFVLYYFFILLSTFLPSFPSTQVSSSNHGVRLHIYHQPRHVTEMSTEGGPAEPWHISLDKKKKK